MNLFFALSLPEGACTDDLLSRKPGFLLSACTVAHFVGICSSLGFLVPWFSSLIDKTDLADFVCICGEEGGGGGHCFFLCKNYISLSLTCLYIFFAMYNFEKI